MLYRLGSSIGFAENIATFEDWFECIDQNTNWYDREWAEEIVWQWWSDFIEQNIDKKLEKVFAAK